MSAIQAIGFGSEWPATPASDPLAANLILAMPCNVSYGMRDVSHKIRGAGNPNDVIARIGEYSSSSQHYGTAPVMGPHLGSSERGIILGMPAFGLSDFCIEAYLKFPSLAETQCVFFYHHNNTNDGFQIIIAGDLFSSPVRGVYVSGGAGASISHTSSNAISANSWFHLAVTRSGSTLRIFFNGINNIAYGGTMTSNWTNSGGASLFSGYSPVWDTCQVQDFRIYQGTAKYTSNFTPQEA